MTYPQPNIERLDLAVLPYSYVPEPNWQSLENDTQKTLASIDYEYKIGLERVRLQKKLIDFFKQNTFITFDNLGKLGLEQNEIIGLTEEATYHYKTDKNDFRVVDIITFGQDVGELPKKNLEKYITE